MKIRATLLNITSHLGAFYVFAACGALIAFLARHGIPVLSKELFFGTTPPFDALFRHVPVWDGILPAVAGTFCLVLLTTLLATIPGIGCGIYLARFAKGKTLERLSLAIDLLSGIPSIIVGLFGFEMILFLHRFFAPNATTCILLAAFCLALLVLPVLVVTTRSAIESLPKYLELTGAALGFSEWQTLRYLLLPAASRGILSGIILATGRAAEDTAVIMLTGVVVNAGFPAGLTAKFEALPFLIYYTAAQYMDEAELARGFGAALVLLFVSVLLVVAAKLCDKGIKNSWKN